MECLKNIIGLSRTECECLTDQLPTGSDEIADYNVSASGVFLDELPGFNLNVASGGDDCAEGGLWQRMSRARENAIQDYKTNLLACLGSNYKPRINNFKGQLGTEKIQGIGNYPIGFAGMKITPLQIKGGFIYINKIGILINQSTNVIIEIYSNKNGGTLIYSSTPIATSSVSTTWAALTEPLELPMWDDSMSQITYGVYLKLDGTFQPKKNKGGCGCGHSKDPADNWLKISGVYGSDITNVDGFKSTSQDLNGIVLDVDVKCKVSEIICSSQYPLDFENDVDAMSIAYAIRFRAAAILYQDLLGTDNINRFSMMNRDEVFRDINEWNGKYTEWINYACLNSNNLEENDCLMCKEGKNDIIKRANIVTGNGHQHRRI